MSPFASNPSGVPIALGRCRVAVIACCWFVGLALAAQMFIWSLATFTELRFEPEQEPGEAPMIVHSDQEPDVNGTRRPRDRRALPRPAQPTPQPELDEESESNEATAERAFSATDRQFAATYNLAAGFGQCAILVLLSVVGLTVMLAAGASVGSVDRTVSSFLWLLLVAILVLPSGNFFTLPWQHGALTTYEHMTASVDALHEQRRRRLAGEEAAAEEVGVSAVEFYTRFALLPTACIVGVTLVGLRYSASLDGALPQRERMQLDPALEREASNITPTSLHAGRSGSVFNRAISGESNTPAEQSSPSARSVSPGEQPKRLI